VRAAAAAAPAATVVASTYCELYSLSRADLEEVLQQWPELAEEFEAMGEQHSMQK
jgi:CRP-like cAMP-binding protein